MSLDISRRIAVAAIAVVVALAALSLPVVLRSDQSQAQDTGASAHFPYALRAYEQPTRRPPTATFEPPPTYGPSATPAHTREVPKTPRANPTMTFEPVPPQDVYADCVVQTTCDEPGVEADYTSVVTYTAFSRPLSETTILWRDEIVVTHWQYTSDHLLLTKTVERPPEKKKTVWQYNYDDWRRLVSWTIDYDSHGDPDHGMAFEYNEYGDLVKQVADDDADGSPDQLWTYSYDGFGQQVRVDYDYDADGAVDFVRHLTWDHERPARLAWYSVADDSPDGPETYYRYDSLGRLLRKEHRDTATGAVWGYTVFDYDDAGRVATLDRNEGQVNEAIRYQYDDYGRLIVAQHLMLQRVCTHTNNCPHPPTPPTPRP